MMMLDHHIEYSQQLPHTGCERHFLGLGGPTKTLVKVPDHRIVSDGGIGRHVQGNSHLPALAPRLAFSQGTSAPVEGRRTHQGGNLTTGQGAQFGKAGGSRAGQVPLQDRFGAIRLCLSA